MLSTAEQAVPQGRLVRRNAARTAILQAGRRVAERDGISAFSLSAVAAEAGFGPSTVFGHFRNKDELLVAIVAEDLAGVASLMRDGVAQRESDASSDEGEWSKFDHTRRFDPQAAAEHGSEEEGQEAVAVPDESAESDAVCELS